jgi:hypothetical protein
VPQAEGAESIQPHKWIIDSCENEAVMVDGPYIGCMFGEDAGMPPSAVLADENMEHHFALFEHTVNTGKHMQVHVPNLCAGTIPLVKKVLLSEVNFLNPHEDGDEFEEAIKENRLEEFKQSLTYSVFEPIVIVGKSLDEALESVSGEYNVKNYENVETPSDRTGAPWMEDFRYAYHVCHGEKEGLEFSAEESKRFKERWARDPMNKPCPRTGANAHSAEWHSAVEDMAKFYHWVHCDRYTYEYMLEWCHHYYHTYTAETITNGMEWRKWSFLKSAYKEYYEQNIAVGENYIEKFQNSQRYGNRVLSKKSYEELAEMWEAALATGHRRHPGI